MDPRVGLDAVEKKNLALTGIEPGPSSLWLVAVTIDLSRILFTYDM
jgi:hypothetical protein